MFDMGILSKLLYPDSEASYNDSTRRELGYGQPARGTPLSMQRSNNRFADQEQGLASLGSGVGGIVMMLAFMNAMKDKSKRPVNAGWNFDPNGRSPAMSPGAASPDYETNYFYNQPSRSSDIIRLMQYLNAMKSQGMGVG